MQTHLSLHCRFSRSAVPPVGGTAASVPEGPRWIRLRCRGLSRFRRIVFVLSTLLVAGPVLAQPSPADPRELCGTVLTPEEATAQRQRWEDWTPGESGQAKTGSTCLVFIAGHIIRTGLGLGGLPLWAYDEVIQDVNEAYAPAGFAFYSISVDYINDDDYYYGDFSYDALRQINVVPNAINIYFTPNPFFPYCGLSSFTTSPVQGIIVANGCTPTLDNHTTVPHEIGHYFDLYHTHEIAFGYEYVDRSNCGVAGDLLCDTPADPGLSSYNMDETCKYTAFSRDPHNDLYDPDTGQYMSYATPKTCRDHFSPEAHDRARTTLNAFRPELSTCSLVAPVISSVDPPSSERGETLDVTLVGSDVDFYTTVALDGDFFVHAVNAAPDTVVVTVTVRIDATPGPHDIVVANVTESSTVTGGFVVESGVAPAPGPYGSPHGADIYPYGSPLTAAHAFVDAVAAAGTGDVVRAAGVVHSGVSLVLDKAITLEGAWSNDFTTRDVVYDKTTLQLSGNISIEVPAGSVLIDGFEIRDGSGSLQLAPIIGVAGGALRINNSDVTLIDCDVHTNNAPYGGGIFAYASQLTLQDVSLSLNGIGNYGGAVYAHTSDLDITDCKIQNNIVQVDGAGLYLENSTVTVDGISVLGNNCLYGGKGGGLYAKGGDLTLRHGLFQDNHAGTGAGAYLDVGTSGELAASTLYANDSGIRLDSAAVSVFNTMVVSSVGDGITCGGAAPPLAYNLVWGSGGSDYVGCSPGIGSVSEDPLFVNAAGADFHLALHAPGIDSGNPDAAYDDPDGSRSDMGRYGTGSFDLQQPSAPQGLTEEVVAGETVLSWTANPEGDLDVYVVYGDAVAGFRPAAATFLTTTTDTSVNLGPVSETTYYRICAVDLSGYASGFSDEVEVPGATAVETTAPAAFFVRQPFPNPFNPTTTIEFGLPTATQVCVRILDLRGREVVVLAQRRFEAGSHQVRWDAHAVASGTYIALVQAGRHETRMKLTIVK
jgi:hypothetical protein